MHSKFIIFIIRWVAAAAGLGGIVFFFHVVLQVKPRTVTLTLLLFILSLASWWGLRYAVGVSFAAGACYNYFFLPPVRDFTISDPQNIVALFVFLITSIVVSRMSERIRQESSEAGASKAEFGILYRLSRTLLQTDEPLQLTRTVPKCSGCCDRRSSCPLLPPGETRPLLDSVHEESKRLSRLVAQSIEMAKVDTQELRTSFASRNLGELISGALEFAERELRHAVQVTLAPRLPNVQVDSTWLHRLLIKLPQNAAKCSSDDGPYIYHCRKRWLFRCLQHRGQRNRH